MDLHYRDLEADSCGFGVQRGLLFTHLIQAAMHAGAELRTGCEVAATTPDGFVGLLSGEILGPFDLVAVCDGARSRLHAGLPNVGRREVYPWGALWTVMDDPQETFGSVLHQVYEGTSTMLGFLPSGRLSASEPRRTSMFWSCTAAQAATIMASDDAVARFRERVIELEPRATGILGGLRFSGQLLFAEYRDTVMQPLHDGNRVFLGDAAHAMSPQLGQGANLALIDAETLARKIETAATLREALEGYSADRRGQLQYYSLASRALTPLFQSDEDWLAPLRDRMFGPCGRVPVLRREMLMALCGRKTSVWPW